MPRVTAADLSTGPVPADVADRVRRVVDADAHVRCRVVDRRLSPGEPSHVLFEVAGAYVVGSAEGDRSPLVLSPIAADRALPGLRLIHDASALRDLMNAWSAGWPTMRVRADLLRYRPGRRATFAIHVTAIGPDRRLRRRQLIAKVYHDGAKARGVHDAMTRLARVASGPELRLVPPVGLEASVGIVGQEAAAGINLGSLIIARGRRSEHGIDRAALALAALHRLPPVTSRVRSVDATIDKLVRRAGRLATVHPAAGRPLVDLVCRIHRVRNDDSRAAVPNAEATTVVHGDAKADQFLLGDGAVTLLDFDHCGLGDPAGDVADFVAKLHQRSLASGRPCRAVAHAFARRFRLAYADDVHVDSGFHERVALHTAVGLARRALRSLQRAPAAPLSRDLVALGHLHLDMLSDTQGSAR